MPGTDRVEIRTLKVGRFCVVDEEAYKILNLNRNNKTTKEDVQKAYLKIQKKIHPDISPETSRLSSIVNEAKEVVLKDLS